MVLKNVTNRDLYWLLVTLNMRCMSDLIFQVDKVFHPRQKFFIFSESFSSSPSSEQPDLTNVSMCKVLNLSRLESDVIILT